VTEVAIAKGDSVVATCRTPTDLSDLAKSTPSSQLLVVKCDVTSETDIQNAFKSGVEKFGRIDIVFNNAGYGILAEVESTPEAAARQLFDVNFWGASAVSREAVRVFRDLNPPGLGGRLYNMSSGGGLVGLPASGYYSASKFALEGLTESLARDLDPSWNIKISLLEPSAFRTKAHVENAVAFPPISAYEKPNLPSQMMRQWFAAPEKSVRGDVHKAAARIYEFSLLKDPVPLRWVIGKELIAGTRARMQSFAKDLTDLEHLSDDLNLPDK
jgi:NAD(P)-dependent dehydrogenase (short-subunit alcohol dehydrogenase family)